MGHRSGLDLSHLEIGIGWHGVVSALGLLSSFLFGGSMVGIFFFLGKGGGGRQR